MFNATLKKCYIKVNDFKTNPHLESTACLASIICKMNNWISYLIMYTSISNEILRTESQCRK